MSQNIANLIMFLQHVLPSKQHLENISCQPSWILLFYLHNWVKFE